MRKGRSQRKTRASLPPLSTRLAAAGAGIGRDLAESRSSRSPSSASFEDGPQVVIGLTDPPESVGEALIEESRETLSLETRESRPTRSRPSLSPESQRALSITPPPVSVEPLPFEPSLEALSVEPPPVSVPEPDPFSERYLPVTEPAEESQPVARASSGQMRALVTPDEMSIPPMGDLSVEPMAEQFFSEGELAHDDEGHDHWEGLDPAKDKVQRKAEPHVVERRARFSRYVTWAVGGAAIVCLAALIRSTTSHSAPAAPPPKAAAALVAEPVALPVAKAAQAPAAAPVVSETPPPPVAAATPAADAKTALQEKNDCRKSLERGKLADAIASGERSVALDAEDGEAWLLLGASYQEKGNAADARRAYTSCVKDGKRGPVGECRQMLR